MENVLLLTFYAPGSNAINHNSWFQDGLKSGLEPNDFHIAYIDDDGNYIGKNPSECDGSYNVRELLESAKQWFNEQQTRFNQLTLGNMRHFTLGNTHTTRHFNDIFNYSDLSNNSEACAYDGGDCCESTCRGPTCSQVELDCQDPNAP